MRVGERRANGVALGLVVATVALCVANIAAASTLRSPFQYEVVTFAFDATYLSVIGLAAAVALTRLDRRWLHDGARALVALVATATAAAAVYTAAALLHIVHVEDFAANERWIVRLGATGAPAAIAFLSIATLAVIARGAREPVELTARGPADPADVVPGVLLSLAAIALVMVAAHGAAAHHAPFSGFLNRVTQASQDMADTGVAIVVLGAALLLRGERRARAVVLSLAAAVGVASVIAATNAAVRASTHPVFARNGNWGRTATVASALASLVLSLVAFAVSRTRDIAEPEVSPPWPDLNVLAVYVTIAAVAMGAYQLTFVLVDDHQAVGAKLVSGTVLTIFTVVIAVGAAYVVSRQGRGRSTAIERMGIAIVALGVLAISAYVVLYVIRWYAPEAPGPFFGTFRQRVDAAVAAVAIAFLALAALYLLAPRAPEPVDHIPTFDELVPG